MDVSELLARYAAGERDFRKADLRDADLSDANLSGADLCYANLCCANLSYAKLSSAKLSGAKLSDANLSGANLSYTDLRGSHLSYTKLSYANLSYAKLSYANLSYAKLSGANLLQSNLSGANLTNADLTNANLVEANLANAILTGAKLDGTILAYQKIAEQLQQENQTLTERLKLLEGQLEKQLEKQKQNQTLTERLKLLEGQLEKQKLTQDLKTVSNQGINAPHKWNNFNFRSKSEIKIAEALDRAGVLFYPNSKARLNKAELRVNKESDFLVFHSGKVGILEVDGRDYHQTAADDHERDRLFKRHGIRIIERFDATRCWNQPEQVVKEFLEILTQA